MATSATPPASRSRKHDESDFMGAIRDALCKCGALIWRNNSGIATWESGQRTRYGLGIGSADLVGLFRGRFVAVEVKAARGAVSPDQVAWRRAVEQAGGLYVLARVGETSLEDVVHAVVGTGQVGTGQVGTE